MSRQLFRQKVKKGQVKRDDNYRAMVNKLVSGEKNRRLIDERLENLASTGHEKQGKR